MGAILLLVGLMGIWIKPILMVIVSHYYGHVSWKEASHMVPYLYFGASAGVGLLMSIAGILALIVGCDIVSPRFPIVVAIFLIATLPTVIPVLFSGL
jgi:hypothetical protein